MATSEHPRLLLHGFLTLDQCKELEFIHRSSGTVGYRPSVFSTTLSHLIATNCGHLILPFVSIRERIKEKVEEFFGCEFELFVEFTGLISWCKGAYIGWHSDDNRPYLKQRDFAAVCYLNNHGKDFKGGIFHFKDGEPSSIVPAAGVLDGERLTLTLWFSRDSAHDEDAKLVDLLSQRLSNHEDEKPVSFFPSPASDNMYCFSCDQMGFDIRCARMHVLGFQLFSLNSNSDLSDSSCGPLELLNKPLRLGRGNEIFDKEFSNSLHALQVVQFYHWKAPELAAARRKTGSNIKPSQSFVLEKMNGVELVIPCNNQLVEAVMTHVSPDDAEGYFNWEDFALAVSMWQEYTCSLYKDLLTLMPYWVTHQTLSVVQ